MSRTSKFVLFAATATVLTLGSVTPASAQATRTWVSGVGDDVNPCSRTAPCKTFAGAISKTAAGGEINCLDPGGYGTITITKSITIDCTGTFGSILNSGVQGVIVNDSATGSPGTIEVILRGLSIDGAGTTLGSNGVRFVSGRSLVLEDVFIQNQGSNGVSITPSGSIEFYAENVTVTDSATGIHIQPTGVNGALRATLRNVRVQNNSGTGLNVNTTGNTAPFGTIVEVEESRFSGNANGILVTAPAGSTAAVVMVDDAAVSNNSGIGISTSGSLARIRVGNTVITGNATGVSVGAGSIINTYGNNRNDGNGNDGAFTLPAIAEE
jgi:hypothetical protein